MRCLLRSLVFEFLIVRSAWSIRLISPEGAGHRPPAAQASLGPNHNCTAAAHPRKHDFDLYRKQYDRKYEECSSEYQMRAVLFYKRIAEVEEHNRKGLTWTATINHLTDWTEKELQTIKGAKNVHIKMKVPERKPRPRSGSLPSSVSYRTSTEAGKDVLNQGPCGSCWAFAVVTVLRGHSQLKNADTRTFSPQQVTSCSPNPLQCGGTGACNGASNYIGFEYAWRTGLGVDADMPYHGQGVPCPSDKMPVVTQNQNSDNTSDGLSHVLGGVDNYQFQDALGVYYSGDGGHAFGMYGWTRLPQNQEQPLMRALADYGPVAVNIFANAQFQSYSSGVFAGCTTEDITMDHNVACQGYGTEGGVNYWLLQNSWGPAWGDAGYIKFLRNGDSYCGLNEEPAYEGGPKCSGGPVEVTVCGMCGILYNNIIPYFKVVR
eukprot:gnl/TRDRNA2_/TRDRNA2_174879_c0_seq1.p1 gnl/TRDRNA2_/TRDRNA2_174879_c0~~gnl/TRDRNA2_/TRDRNA2_174879_c0_seq1.p1  ORF type:complete len:432 (+),score=20.26 gnl/TRDRNA2_/TRDRNA2_174879_c0_seq1:57-1352(+)